MVNNSWYFQGTRSWGPVDDKFGKRVVRMVGEFANRSVATMKRYENVPKVTH